MAGQWKKQASVAYGYALARLALNGFMYFEELPSEYDVSKDAKSKQKWVDETFQKLLGDLLDGTLDLECTVQFRSRIQNEMAEVIAYTDCFRNYEYALNRVERRFDDTLPESDVSDEEFCREVLSFITSVKDAADMNRRIQEMIGQLPVRFTRQKYYGMVREALSVYIGADGEALENIMYLLRTGGMVELTEEQKEIYPELRSYLAELEALSFRTLTKEAYQKASQIVSLASEMLIALSEYYQTMQEMVNDLYLAGLTGADAVRDAAQESCAMNLLRGLLETKGGEISEELEEQLCGLEGVQEEYYEKYQRLDPVPEYQEGEDADAGRMRQVDLLMSTSTFVSLDTKQAKHTVETAEVDRAFEAFVRKMDPIFQNCQKPVMRAVMATTLSTLPVCFNSLDEIRNYIRNSLGGCSDLAEKEACKDLIHQLMESEDYEML